MSDPIAKRKIKRVAQAQVRLMVEREVTPVIQASKGPTNAAEEALIRAIYKPDDRMI